MACLNLVVALALVSVSLLLALAVSIVALLCNLVGANPDGGFRLDVAAQNSDLTA